MRLPGWRSVLVPMVVVVAGCLPRAAPGIPASFAGQLRDDGRQFTALPTSRAEESPDAVVGSIRGWDPAQGRAVPVFGVLTCIVGHEGCLPGRMRQERYVWLVIFPEVTGPAGDVAWVLLGDDDDFHTYHDPRE